ncbi:MAG: transporter [Prolixibacteraceae bacterium]|nr:transporter [Prolixibacteraceae bacterium]
MKTKGAATIEGSQSRRVRAAVLVFAVFGMMAAPVLLHAQTCCSGGVPLGGSLGLGAAENQALQILVTYDYNALNDLVDISEQLDDQTRSRITHSSIIEVNYGLTNRFSLTGVLPFIRQERNIQAFGGTEDFTAAQGLGDVVLLAKYRLINPEKGSDIDWVVGAGPKIPTAKTDFTNNQGLVMAADMQPGSGSLDGIFWSSFQKNRFLKNPNLGLVAVTTFRYSGKNRNYNDSQTYQFGNEFQFNLGLNYSLFVKRQVDVFAFFRYRKQAEDLIDGGVFPSSGGQWVYAIPGVNIRFSPDLSLRLSGDIPLYRKLDGTQLTTSYKLTAAVLFNLPLKKKSMFTN